MQIESGERGERRLWRMKRPERVAAVDKIEDQRKPEDFVGHRNRTPGTKNGKGGVYFIFHTGSVFGYFSPHSL